MEAAAKRRAGRRSADRFADDCRGGQPVLISNLDLEGLAGVPPSSSASSPEHRSAQHGSSDQRPVSVRQPCGQPPNRPAAPGVDAGYLDNYGVDLAAEWLERRKDWAFASTSGVILVQILRLPARPGLSRRRPR